MLLNVLFEKSKKVKIMNDCDVFAKSTLLLIAQIAQSVGTISSSNMVYIYIEFVKQKAKLKLKRDVMVLWPTTIEEFLVQNTQVARRSSQPFRLSKLINRVPGTAGNLVIKSKLSTCSSSIVLRQ